VIEIFLNIYSGVRYASVRLENKRYDIGVAVLKFCTDGRCRAAHLEFLGDYEQELLEDHRRNSSCFNFPFIPTYPVSSVKTIQHPMGWRWKLGKKRLSYKKAVSDFCTYKAFVRTTSPNKTYINLMGV
jgi:hypothetical protein